MLQIEALFQPFAAQSAARGVTAHPVTAGDYAEIGMLHDRIFGPGALTRTAYRIREGLPGHTAFCRIARAQQELIGFIRFAPITIGGRAGALMLGPLAVAAEHANAGHARRLIGDGLAAAQLAGLALVILVGDRPYYGRLGFMPVPVGQITMPGPVDPTRLLAFPLMDTALHQYLGQIAPQR
jgi:predicted N-acetyltransferase YhbS